MIVQRRLMLNIGSGQRPFGHGWTNIDLNPKWNPDIVADAAEIPLPDNSAELIVLHHVIEHAGCGGGGIIEEAYRLLTFGGSLLIFVPDLWELAQMWIEGRISDQIYFTNIYGAFMDDEADRHHWGYSRDSLKSALACSRPWSRIRNFDWRHIDGADIARDRWILAVEAIK